MLAHYSDFAQAKHTPAIVVEDTDPSLDIQPAPRVRVPHVVLVAETQCMAGADSDGEHASPRLLDDTTLPADRWASLQQQLEDAGIAPDLAHAPNHPSLAAPVEGVAVVEVVRGRARQALPGHQCRECEQA